MTSDNTGSIASVGVDGSSFQPERFGVRITSPGSKAFFFAGGYFVVFCAGILCWHPFHFTVASVVYLVLFLFWTFTATRSFRGKGEPITPPRPWWKLSARPTAGWVVAGLLLLQATDLVASSPSGAGGKTKLLIATIYLVVARLFIYSSVRLIILNRVSRH